MYASQHAGESTEITSLDKTNYSFEINPNNIQEALDRFSQSLLHPNFTVSAIEREVKYVHSEYKKNLASDEHRYYQHSFSSAGPQHSYSGFYHGNIETLEINPKEENIDVRKELRNFHSKWYSSDIMALSVLGKGNYSLYIVKR